MKQAFIILAQQQIPTPPGIPRVTADNSAVSNVLALGFIAIGAISVLFIIIGAIRYAISAGDQSQITAAKNTVLYAIIGLALSISGVAIVQFVLRQVIF